MMTSPTPNRDQILEMMAGFRPACVIGAAAELDLFTTIGQQAMPLETIAEKVHGDRRAIRILLDAVAALGLLDKHDERYEVPMALRPLLSAGSPQCILPMIWHSMAILRGWSQLAWIGRAGIPGPRTASIRGAEADRAAFVAAMHTVSGPIADGLVARMGPPQFRHLLDVGGASGTWTLALLRAVPGARATIFDLPDAIEQARSRLQGSELADRVTLAAGDFYVDPLPAGADYAWVSAIIHQHSREHNRALFAKVFAALERGGRVGVRDIVMDASRTRPVFGALFAVNMLANTDSGDTYSLEEISADLQAAGFVEPRLAVAADDMQAVVEARKP
jgi:predicted O-methyltransferase YrrM